MKHLVAALLVLACAFPIRADNWLDNGDFSSGIDHWRGNGRSPADFASDNPFDKPDPFLSKGLIIELQDGVWRKVQQDFKGKLANGTMTITFMLSPDFAFSDNAEDYDDIPTRIDYEGWRPFKIPVGTWLVFIADFGTNHGSYYTLKPKLGSSAPQMIKTSIKGLTPYGDKTITLAFPPGKGKLVILSVSIEDK